MLLAFVFEKHKEQDFTDLLEFLEFWFICRHATNEPPTHQLDKIFAELTHTQKQDYDFELIKSTLFGCLDKDRIKKSLSNADIYDYPNLVRNILIRLEQNLRNKQTAVDFWKKTNKQPVWTIEHIYPQNPHDEKDWGDDEQNARLKQKLHSLGNLTLTCYNGSYSNKKYAEKCQVTDDGKPVGLINGDIKINQTLPTPSDNTNDWTAKEIDERTEWLIEQFLDFFYKS
ncbi:MAG: HNH endonuclease family protein [Moraxella sp.]|nr:HNH endonuclease family protein [Moraxella sp.]